MVHLDHEAIEGTAAVNRKMPSPAIHHLFHAFLFLHTLTLATNAPLYAYHPTQAGTWVPPRPPLAETVHLTHLNPHPHKLPPPSFLATPNAPTDTPRRRRLLGDDDAATGLEPQKVPHNWFGTDPYVAPLYSIMSGKEECNVCKAMLESASRSTSSVELDTQRAGSEATPAEPTSPAAVGNADFCAAVKVNYKTTCKSYATYLSTCPSFIHNLCHEDVGGSERLRSPCPRHLVCYYCLRINPIHCLDYLDEDN